MCALAERISKAEHFFQRLYESPPPAAPLSPEDNKRVSEVLRKLCAPNKTTTFKKEEDAKSKPCVPLRLSSVVSSLGYSPVDRGTLLRIAARLEKIFKRVRGRNYRKPCKSLCFCLGLGEERTYSEKDRAFIRMAILDVLG